MVSDYNPAAVGGISQSRYGFIEKHRFLSESWIKTDLTDDAVAPQLSVVGIIGLKLFHSLKLEIGIQSPPVPCTSNF